MPKPTLVHRAAPSIPRGVARIVSLLQPVAGEAGDSYASLAARVETFLEETAPGQGWGALDVFRFVRCEAFSRADRIAICCNLCALVACIADTEELSRTDARRIWEDLRVCCPDDERAQEYLDIGAQQFGLR